MKKCFNWALEIQPLRICCELFFGEKSMNIRHFADFQTSTWVFTVLCSSLMLIFHHLSGIPKHTRSTGYRADIISIRGNYHEPKLLSNWQLNEHHVVTLIKDCMVNLSRTIRSW